MGRTQRRRELRKAQQDKIAEATVGINVTPGIYQQLHAQGWNNDTQLSISAYPYSGRGLCSKKRTFQIGDELIRLPIKCIIHIGVLEADENFQALFNVEKFDKNKRVTFQALLAFYLLYQQHMHSQNKSKISSFIQALPQSYSTPYFCTVPELQCLPEAILERTVAQNRRIRDCYLVLKDICGLEEPHVANEFYSLSEFRRAYFAVNTRSIYFNAKFTKNSGKCFFEQIMSDDTKLALAPFLDFFNHSDTVETKAELSSRGTIDQQWDFVLRLEKAKDAPIKPYSQLYISYGPLNNFKLLTEYGFYISNNKHDYFEITLTDIQNMIKYHKKANSVTLNPGVFKYIRDHNLTQQMFVHERDGASHNLKVVLFMLFKQHNYFPSVLNQIAYGDPTIVEDVQQELSLMVSYKIVEYQRYAAGLLKLSELTASGMAAMDYLLECVRYLESFEAAHCAV